MNNTFLLSPCQLENYSRVPNSLIDSKDISHVFKKILVFSYGIQVNGYIPVCNLIKGWKGNRSLGNSVALPSQLRKLLIHLENAGFIERIFNKGKFTAIRLNFDHTLIKNDSYFFLTKKITSDKDLGLDEILIAATYARFNYLNVKYTSKLSAIIGMGRKTFAGSVKKLNDCGFLLTYTRKSTQYSIKTYSLKDKYIIKKYTRKTFGQSMKQTELDDFYPLRNYFINKIKNNTSMLGIMYKEMKNKGKTLTDYLNMSDAEWTITANAVRCILAQRGEILTVNVVRCRMIRHMIDNCQNEKIKFSHDQRLYAYLTKAISRKNYNASFDPSSNAFISDLSKELPYDIPLQRVRDEVKEAIRKGFMFKTELHALNFFKARFDKKDLSLEIKEIGRRERIADLETQPIYLNRASSLANIISKFNINMEKD